ICTLAHSVLRCLIDSCHLGVWINALLLAYRACLLWRSGLLVWNIGTSWVSRICASWTRSAMALLVLLGGMNALSPRIRAMIINYDPTQPGALSVSEFCKSIKISRSVFYKIRSPDLHRFSAPVRRDLTL